MTTPDSLGEFTGLSALVTGGSSGIGAAIIDELTARGAHAAVLDRTPPLETAAALTVVCDVTDDGSVRAAVASVASHFGGLDVVINCAGIGATGTVADNDDDEWRTVFDVNVLGMVRTSRAALEHLRASSFASVVNVGSIAGTAGLPQRALYSASKGAVHALTRGEWRPITWPKASESTASRRAQPTRHGCSACYPWPPTPRRSARSSARQPHGRLVTAEEVAGAVAYLASPRSGSTTGVVLAVDGGMHDLRLRPRS